MSVRIVDVREITQPISSPIRNAYIDFTKMTTSLVAVVVQAGARRVVVAMQHHAKGMPKIVESLTLPPTSARPVSLVVTELAVIIPTRDGLVLHERAPGVSLEEICALTGAPLIVAGPVPEMALSA